LEAQKVGRLEDQKVDPMVGRLEGQKVDHSLEDRKVDPMVGRMEGQKVNQMADRLVAQKGAGFEIRRVREAGLMGEEAVLLP